MAVLCLDTSGPTTAAVVLEEDGWRGGTCARAQSVLAAVDGILEGGARRLDAVVVAVGPGGFTGLRIGVSTGRGIAEALAIPLHGMDSMLSIAAEAALADPQETVWAVLDARRGEAFVQPWRGDADGVVRAQAPMQAIAADDVDLVVGSARRVDGPATPASLAIAARQVLRQPADTGDPLAIRPAYGREPDASPPRLEVVLDELGREDIDAVLVLEARCFDAPWTRGMYEEELARPATDRVLLAARDAGSGRRLFGAALAARVGDCWHVMNVLVDPVARRRGIAARLVRELLERTAAAGAGDGWVLEVRDDNSSAIALYHGLGFREVGRRPGYYQDTGDDALVMARGANDAQDGRAT